MAGCCEAAEKPKRNSKLPSETVVLLVLCVLLAAALIIFIRHSLRTANQSIQTLREENEALWKNLSGWEEHGGNCYYFDTDELNWTESRSFCRDVGGDLVKIDSREEQEFLVRRLRDKMISIEDWFWIGLTDLETEGSWLWVDRSPLDKSFWINGEPNNVGNEDCVALTVDRADGDLQTWNDFPCRHVARFICEKPPGSAQSSCV
ncbi:CD209 antigen-like protein E [Austrofundulus limnaeus]|uniref:CD209 antigen-like protein E n=1 Tax=Austrofundulus limnaeus TaxID=52670 RepID=A0A2I4CPX0_AUSLI|nr:PREDICTED: CD209 antigen-like protein E [Austrofundulus limnaeus]